MKIEDRGWKMAGSFRQDRSTIFYSPFSILHLLPSLAVALVLLTAGCATNENGTDAYGNFEATEVVISAEQGGRLLRFTVEEGTRLKAGELVGVTDTTQLVLRRRELIANREAARTRLDQVRGEVDVVQEELATARTQQQRLQRLVADNAATQQQLDDIDGRVRVLQQRIQATRTQLRTIRNEIEAINASIARVEQQLDDSRIVNPLAGTVLTTYAEPDEMVGQGAPLYKIANLRTMYLRAYVSGAQLSNIRLGQPVTVRIDKNPDEYETLPGEISWIADEAEFTPKMIQTKEERVNFVYAFKVRVENPEGTLKIGMPGEVLFGKEEGGDREGGSAGGGG